MVMKRPADRMKVKKHSVRGSGHFMQTRRETRRVLLICSRGCGRLLPLGVPVFYRGNGALSRDRKPVSAEKFGFGGVVGDKKDGFVTGNGAHRVHGGAAVRLVQPLERLVECEQVKVGA